MKRAKFIKLGLTGGFLGGIGMSLVGLKGLVFDADNPRRTLSFNVQRLTANFHVRHGLYVAPSADVVYSTSVSQVTQDVFARGGVSANDKLDMSNLSFNLKGERYSLHLLGDKLLFKGGGVSGIQKLNLNVGETLELLVNDRIECHLYSKASEVCIQKPGEYVLIPMTKDITVNHIPIEQDTFMSSLIEGGSNLQLRGGDLKVLLIKTS